MRKTIKWAVVTSALVIGLGALFFGTDVVSYAKTLLGVTRRSVKGMVPLEFQLQRCRDLNQGLVLELDRQVRQYSTEELAAERLDKENQEAARTAAMPAARERLLKLKKAVEGGGPAAQDKDLQLQLASAFREYKSERELLDFRKAALDQKRKALTALRGRIGVLRSDHARLEAETERLAAMAQVADAAGADSRGPDLPDTAARIEAILKELEENLAVTLRTEQNRRLLVPPKQAGRPEPAELLPAINAYLAQEPGAKGQP